MDKTPQYDLNNEKYLNKLIEVGNSKDGLIIVDFLKRELNKINFEKIDGNQLPDKIGLEYLVIKKSREYLKKVLKYLIGE